MGKMFEFITATHNPIVGICRHACTYCWARKYMGRAISPETLEKRMAKRFGKGDFVFLCDLWDAFAEGLVVDHGYRSGSALIDFANASPDARFLFCTKNPRMYAILETNKPHFAGQRHSIPKNVYLGATIETDMDSYTRGVSFAPAPSERLYWMQYLANYKIAEGRLFISVEPIITFSPKFAEALIRIKPWGVAVGYDNYNHELREPPLEHTERLISSLENAGIKVYRKTLRKAWWEGKHWVSTLEEVRQP